MATIWPSSSRPDSSFNSMHSLGESVEVAAVRSFFALGGRDRSVRTSGSSVPDR